MSAVAAIEAIATHRLAVPGAGSTLSAATERRARPVRGAVDIIQACLATHPQAIDAYRHQMMPRWRGIARPCAETSRQLAWGLVAMRMVGRLLGELERNASMNDAQAWFLGGADGMGRTLLLNRSISDEAVDLLEQVSYDGALGDLLPYVLDSHGPGSRASVIRDPATRKAREAKRATGVFYTPADVAEYIVDGSIDDLDFPIVKSRLLDPACGSGVFLKAALDVVASRQPDLDLVEYAQTSLFGLDVDPLALDAAAFVLLYECSRRRCQRDRAESPWSRWHSIRMNLAEFDALTVGMGTIGDGVAADWCFIKAQVEHEYVAPRAHDVDARQSFGLFGGTTSLGDLLPPLADGAELVVGNPPYAPIHAKSDAVALRERFASFAPLAATSQVDCFPLFTEMLWLLGKPGRCAGGMVLPLSIAYHGGRQMTACRRAVATSGGRWRFAFFDREPHALFGEDVKTRNAIAFRRERRDDPQRGENSVIETGPLRRWSSRTRHELFGSVTFTRLNSCRIESGIPKLACADDARVFEALERSGSQFGSWWASVRAVPPACAADPSERPRVFIATTAYNFLGVFRPHVQPTPRRAPWSENKLICLEYLHEADASRAMAILSSRVVYWLWRVLGDGFHVTRGFLEAIPFDKRSLGPSALADLARLGAELWQELQPYRFISVNGGRQSVAYRPLECETLRDEIDRVLLAAAGLPVPFADRLKTMVRELVNADVAPPITFSRPSPH